MLDQKFHRGFSEQRLANTQEPRVRRDEKGYYIMTLSEKAKVYFEDYYTFLEATHLKASAERDRVIRALADTPPESRETASYYRAKLVIIDVLLRSVRRFYTDGSSFGIIMTPWCFGTVVLEKVEVYRDRLSRGDVHEPYIDEYPYDVVQYIDEIYKVALLELFDFPEQAFNMRWQYSELLKRYSKMLANITTSLQSVIASVRNLH
jgi:hypothetical protein